MNKNLSEKELIGLKAVRNFLIHNGRFPSLRELMTLLHYRSPRSSSLLIERLISKQVLTRKKDGSLQLLSSSLSNERAQTLDVPLVGRVSCGSPLYTEENIEAVIPISTKLLKSSSKHFLLRAKGDSMNKADINDGDLVLVRQQSTASNGDIVVALIDEEATIKEFNRAGEMVALKPNSRNKDHKPIILTGDFVIQGIVVSSIPGALYE